MLFNSEKVYLNSPVWLQNTLISIYGVGLWKKRYGGNFKRVINELRNSKNLEKKMLEEASLARLRKILEFCVRNIPYYEQHYSESKLYINEVKDLEQIPILTKETFRARFPLFIPFGFDKSKVTIQKTSGSTGTPISLYVDKYTYQLSMALLVEHEKLHGIAMGEKKATFAGRMLQDATNNTPPFWRYNVAENQMLFSAYHLSDKNYIHYINKLNKFKPKEIIGYPSAIYAIATYCDQENIKVEFHPKAIITNSETLFEWQRLVIEKVFGCKIYDYYGSAECLVFAGQCSESNYHINPLLGILEVVDENGKSIKNNVGRIVCTTLTNYAMPLIRYEIGDMGIFSDEKCKCGCNYPILKSIEGRMDDVVVTRSGKKIGRLDHIFKGVAGIKECQVVQVKISEILLNIVKGNGFKNSSIDKIKINLTERVGDEFTININFLEKIPLTSRGKFKGVVSHVK